MSTAFAQVVGAMIDVLQAGTPVAQGVYRARMRPVAQQFDASVVVRPIDAQATPFAILNGPVDWTTQIAVECYARAAPGTSPDVAVDALLAAVYARLASDPTLGALVMDINPTALAYDFFEDAEQLACVTVTYSVLHRTQHLSLE